jgi:prolyl 4-hydroxylase
MFDNCIIIVIVFIIIIVVIFYKKLNYEYIEPKVYESLVTQQEADYILQTASNSFQTSTTVGGLDKNIRDSQTTWISKSDPIVKSIIHKLSHKFLFDVNNAEDLQIVKYLPNGFYKEHHDSCCDETAICRDFIKKSGQRILTILIYLNDDFEEGATSFPNLNLKLKPSIYSGIVFYPLYENRCHPKALHTGTPVKSGVKYVCNVWVREREW